MMKRFIKQLRIFFFFLALLIATLFMLLNYTSRRQIENYRFGSGINKLIVGDSHTQNAINDELLKDTKNISQNAECCMYSYYKLKSLLKNNPQIDTVLLGVSYHSFSAYIDYYAFLPTVSDRYFFILPTPIQIEVLKNVTDPVELIRECFRNGFRNLKNPPDKLTFLGAYKQETTKVALSDESIQTRIQGQYFEKGKLYDFSESNIYYYNKIKELCKKQKIELIILNTPRHVNYDKQVPPKFKEKFNSMTTAQCIKLIDFQELKLDITDFLPDGDHLSVSGANRTSKYLRGVLNQGG